MPISEAKKRANRKWNEENKERYDRVQLVLPKGAKERVKARADANGESVNGYVWRLVSADLDSEGEKG